MTLAKLSQLPLAIAPDDPDLLGWPVLGSDEHLVGTVIDLLVEAESQDARYLVIQTTNGLDIPLPLGAVSIMAGDGRILARQRTSHELRELPALPPDPIDLGREKQLYATFLPHHTVDYDRPEFRMGGERAFHLEPLPPEPLTSRLVPSPEGWRGHGG